jgi:hypothetical protein
MIVIERLDKHRVRVDLFKKPGIMPRHLQVMCTFARDADDEVFILLREPFLYACIHTRLGEGRGGIRRGCRMITREHLVRTIK